MIQIPKINIIVHVINLIFIQINILVIYLINRKIIIQFYI